MAERPSLTELGTDLAAEQADLISAVTPLDEQGWASATPATGWSVRDQIAHLAYFDGAAALAASDPEAFEKLAALAEVPGFESATLRGELSGAATLEWWREESAGLHGNIAGLNPAQRVPWYGPPMSALSMVTARIMETWAHGQDVCDALGVARVPTARLRHIAHIGVRTLAFSYAVRGREPPATPVRVELTTPGGETWDWGPTDAEDVVRGPAIDFCLVVTQRRHRQDTALESSGPVAAEWLGLAQAFAGPPGSGRPPAT